MKAHIHTLVHTDVHTHKTHAHTFSRTVSAEGLGECGGVGDVVGWVLFRHQGNHWAICHLKRDQDQSVLHRTSSSKIIARPHTLALCSNRIYFPNCYFTWEPRVKSSIFFKWREHFSLQQKQLLRCFTGLKYTPNNDNHNTNNYNNRQQYQWEVMFSIRHRASWDLCCAQVPGSGPACWVSSSRCLS